MNDLSGLEDLMSSLDNVLNQANNFEGELTINLDNLVNNIDNFNHDFDTSFSKDTTIEEFQEYFRDEYVSLMQDHLTDNFDYKAHFNDIYLNYAHIE